MSTIQHGLQLTVVMILVLLLPALLMGLLISMFQAATQINEMTLSFVPKLLVILGTIMLAGPWLMRVMMDFTRRLVEGIPFLIG